jgi:glutathione S-transferase
MLKILGKASSINVRKVLWCCEETGISFEREDWGSGYRDTQKQPFLALNPNALVPVIVDGDFVLWESNTIIRYLASSHGATELLPVVPKERAKIEQWMDWQATELNGSWRYAFQALVRKNPRFSDPGEILASTQAWSRNMEILNRQLEISGGYAAGREFTLADIPLGLSVNRWYMTPIEHPSLEAVKGYHDRLNRREGYKRYGQNGIA